MPAFFMCCFSKYVIRAYAVTYYANTREGDCLFLTYKLWLWIFSKGAKLISFFHNSDYYRSFLIFMPLGCRLFRNSKYKVSEQFICILKIIVKISQILTCSNMKHFNKETPVMYFRNTYFFFLCQ